MQPLHELLQSGPQLFRLLDSAPDSTVIVDAAGIIVMVNRQTEAMFGYRRDELLGKPVEILFPGRFRDDPRVARAAYSPVTRPVGSGVQLHGLRRDRTEFPVEISTAPVTSVAGTHLFNSIRDLSERQFVDAEMRTLSALVESSADAILACDAEGAVITWNKAAQEMFGYSAEEMIGKQAALVFPLMADPAGPAMLTLLQRNAEFDAVGQHRNGSSVEASVRLSPLGGAAERGRGFSAIIRALPPRHDPVEAERGRVQLAEARELAYAGFERSPIGTAIADLDGRLRRVNAALGSILGRDDDEILGRQTQEFLHPLDADDDATAETPFVASRDDARMERRYLRPDGAVVWVHEIVSLVRDDGGSPSYYYLQLQDISERKEAEARLAHQAFHDPLTGLANRMLLTEHIDAALARSAQSGTQVGVLFLDVDQFKIVNDGLGHAAGDSLLVQLVERLQVVLRDTDTFARFGGDEFVIVFDSITVERAQRVANRIVSMTKEPFMLDAHEVFVTVSIGIVIAGADDDSHVLLRKSDVAMYQAKALGRERVVIFDEDMQLKASARLDIESQLARALDRDELRVMYQPIVDVVNQRAVGFEALVRWEHPERGWLSPSEFIPVAEETGMILLIGEWVLGEALAQLQRWRRDVPGAESLTMAVNLSTRQLRDSDFVGVVARTLVDTGIEPCAVHLEITESMVMGDVDLAVSNLLALRALGVRLSIDDFGTGYSSLGYLRQLPVQLLKIDRSFIDGLGGPDPHAAAIVGAIVALARDLELGVIGEGVESPAQLAELNRLGTGQGQGFLWSTPLLATDVPSWLHAQDGQLV